MPRCLAAAEVNWLSLAPRPESAEVPILRPPASMKLRTSDPVTVAPTLRFRSMTLSGKPLSVSDMTVLPQHFGAQLTETRMMPRSGIICSMMAWI